MIVNDSYYDILINAIPTLKTAPRYSGGEGTAYFLSEDLVIKEYTDSSDWEEFDKVFETYCKEMRKFGEQGYSVPKIYAWLKLPNLNYYSGNQKNRNKYYILEERVKGRNLYYGYLEDFYPVCKSAFSRSEYMQILNDPGTNMSALEEVVKIYLQDYVKMNEMLASMSEEHLAKFVTDAYAVHMQATRSEPDLFPSNVLISGNDIKFIDNHVYIDGDRSLQSKEHLDNTFLANLVNLFYYNANVSDIRNVCFVFPKEKLSSLSRYKKKNQKACAEVMSRLLSMLSKYCDNPKCSDPKTYLMLVALINNFVGKDNAQEVVQNIETTFQP